MLSSVPSRDSSNLNKLPRQPTEKQRLLEHAARLRDLANRGMATKKYNKEADRLEALAAEIEE